MRSDLVVSQVEISSESCNSSQSDCLRANRNVAHGNLLRVTRPFLPSPCVILKAICAGVGWVWLARLGGGRRKEGRREGGTPQLCVILESLYSDLSAAILTPEWSTPQHSFEDRCLSG